LIVEAMITWCEDQGTAGICTPATTVATLYETLGFKPTNEMRLELK
jgi:hypothetical protein